jgi:hypothetical protein
MHVKTRAALLAVAMIASSTPVWAEEVGKTSAIIPAASQKVPQGTRSDLNLRDPVIRNAELATAANGALEVTFLDGSRLSMGQNSRLTVDEYVYTGPGGAGKQTVRYGKGLFRFLSGSIPKDQVKIDTPTVTIGIRGTIIRTLVNEDGSGKFAVEEGPNGEVFEAYLTNKKTGEKLTLRSGQVVDFGADGGFGGILGGTIEGCQ